MGVVGHAQRIRPPTAEFVADQGLPRGAEVGEVFGGDAAEAPQERDRLGAGGERERNRPVRECGEELGGGGRDAGVERLGGDGE